MKKLLLSTCAVMLFAGTAGAADLARAPMYTKAPSYVAPVTLWNGFYIGGHVGYAWQDLSASVGGVAIPGLPRPEGIFGGGQIGYNWQLSGPFVLGVEADISGADVNDSVALGGGVTASSKTDLFGTARGRIGYSFGSTLLYATGGYAWANNRVSVNGGGASLAESRTHSGYAVGAGVEWMFAQGWSAKLEYLYMGFDTEKYTFGLPALAAAGGISTRIDQQTVKLGINYHFNWGAPVVARY